MTWPEVSLADVADVLVGYAFKSAGFSDLSSDIRLVRGVNIGQGEMSWSSQVARWPASDAAGFERYTLAEGDVVLAMDRPWIDAGLKRARISVADLPALLVQRVARLRGTARIETSLIHHLLAGPTFTAYIKPIVTGVTVPHISLRQIGGFRFRLPPLEAQRSICAVLDAIDDLIENNRRRVELLEQMAQAIYREWFVHFRYPGHEHDELVDSPIGPIPSSWSVTTLGAAGKWLSGGTPSTTNPAYWEGEIPWITSGSLTSILLDRSERRVTAEGLAHGTRLVPRDTLLFVVRGMSLVREFRVGITDVPLAFGQDCKAIVARAGMHPLYLGFAVISMANEIQGMVELAGHGTGKLSTDRIQAIEIPEPSLDVQAAFAQIIEPIRRSMSTIRDQTDRLVSIRDLLLPRLVTGQIDVSKLDLDSVLEGAGV